MPTARASAAALSCVNTLLSNVKRTINDINPACALQLGRYLAESAYRFNRRSRLAHLVPHLDYFAVRITPMLYRLRPLAGIGG